MHLWKGVPVYARDALSRLVGVEQLNCPCGLTGGCAAMEPATHLDIDLEDDLED